MITFTHKGDFSKTYDFLRRAKKISPTNLLQFGEEGVRALQAATPRDTGKTAESWYFQVVEKNGSISIQWLNSNIVDGVPIAVILQYGHGTRNGGYVEGRDYINPAIQPIFDKIADRAWKEVTR